MSTAYKCDICGDFVTLQAEAMPKRNLFTKNNMKLNEQNVDVDMDVAVGVANVCNTCWTDHVNPAVKAWINANI